MAEKRRLVVIGKQRAYDEERWRQLVMAMTYVLHEQRQQQDAAELSAGRDAPEDEGTEAAQ